MDLIQLQYFVTVVEVQNVTRAAELLHITQPALSKAISRIEDEVGESLFYRVGRQNALNSYGELFYHWAKKSLTDYDSLIDHIHQLKEDGIKKITVAISSVNFTAPIIKSFYQKFPDVRIKEILFTKEDFPDILYDPKIDCVLSTKLHSGPKVHHHLIAHDQLYLVVPPNHRFASYDRVSLREARDEYFIITSSKYLFNEVILDLFRQAGYSPKVAAETESTHMFRMVDDGLGLCICSETAKKEFARQTSCKLVPLSDDYCYRDTFLLWTDQNILRPSAASFINFVIDNKRPG